MAEFILIQTVVNLFWAFMWSTNGAVNTLIKMAFFCFVAAGVYLLFGPTNAISLLSH